MSLSIAPPSNRLIHAAQALLSEGRVLAGHAPLEPSRLNTRFDEVRALLRAAGFPHALEFAGYQARAYALYDPSRFSEVEMLRWLRDGLGKASLPAQDHAPQRGERPSACALVVPPLSRHCHA